MPPKIKGILGGRGKRGLAIITSGTDDSCWLDIPLQYMPSLKEMSKKQNYLEAVTKFKAGKNGLIYNLGLLRYLEVTSVLPSWLSFSNSVN